MLKIIRTDSNSQDFIELVKHLDADLAKRDGDQHPFYAQFNKIDKIKHAIVAYENNRPIACGAIKKYSPDIMEIKRMYTLPDERGKGIAGRILSELELWAAELSYKTLILETGKKQREAINLYQKAGYSTIKNYGQYENVENSVCMSKAIL